MIFDSIEKGLSKKEIVDILNNKKIKTPMEYIKNSDEGKMWNISMIIGILNNKVYTGDLIQQKRKRISFKNHKFVKTREDELIITKNNHMEIISKEQFERVQDILKHSVKVNSNNEFDLFSGYLKCTEYLLLILTPIPTPLRKEPATAFVISTSSLSKATVHISVLKKKRAKAMSRDF